MNNILNNLPKKRLSKTADLKLKTKLYFMVWRKSIISSTHLTLLQQATVAFVLFVFISTSISTYAYASSGVTAGSVLYPLKTNLEKIELLMTKSSSTLAKKHFKFADKRLKEAQHLISPTSPKKEDLVNLTLTFDKLHREIISTDKSYSSSTKIKYNQYLIDLRELAQNMPIDEEHLSAMQSLAKTATYLKQKKGEYKNLETHFEVKDVEQINTSSAAEKTATSSITTSNDTNSVKKQLEFANKIKYIKQRVEAIKKKSGQINSDKKRNELISELRTEVKKAENSARKEDLSDAYRISQGAVDVINNAEMFIEQVPPTSDKETTSSPESNEHKDEENDDDNKTSNTQQSSDENRQRDSSTEERRTSTEKD